MVRQTAFIYLTEILARLANFASVILIVRYMGEDALGKISYASSLVFLFAVFTDLGYALVSIKYFAQTGRTDKTVLNPGFTLKLLSSAAVFAVLAVYSAFVPADPSVSLLTILFALDLVISSFLFPYRYAFAGLRLFQYDSVLKVLTSALSLMLLLVLLKIYPDVAAVGAGIPLACSTVSFFYFQRLNRGLGIVTPGLTFDRAKLAVFFRSCLPFSIGAIVVMFHQKIGVILLKEFSGFAGVGVFVIAYKIIEALNMIPNVILGIIFPAFSSFFVKWDEQAEKAVFILTKYLLIISVPVAVLVCFFGGGVLGFLMKKPIGDSGALLQVLAWALIPSFLYSVTGGLINAGPKPGANTSIHIFMAAVYLALLFIFLPSRGFIGLAYSLVIVEWLGLLVRMVYIRRRICLTDYPGIFLKVFAAAGIAFIPLFLNKGYAAGAVSLLIYAGVLGFSGYVNKDEFLAFYRHAGSYGA